LPAVLRGDAISNNKYIAAPTISEIVRARGGTTAIVAAKGVGLIFDRHVSQDSHCPDCVTIFEGNVFPSERAKSLLQPLGEFPALEKKNFVQTDAWTTRALTEQVWGDRIPTLSVLWLSAPDGSEHMTAPGSTEALAAIKSSDENLARVLAALDQHHSRADTDVLVVSDHGFSTIERSIDLRKILKAAGFDAVTEVAGEPKPGQIMMAGNGGSVLFYVIGHDPGLIGRLVEFLQQSDFAGVIFTRDTLDGTFPLDAAKLDSQHAADVVMAFRWNENKNQFDVPGMIEADWQRVSGKGTHATLGRFDMHNTLIAVGPDFPRGLTSELPSGNIDLAPTMLAILGIESPPMDGRVLNEAIGKAQSLKPQTEKLEATKKFSNGIWRQYLQVTRVGSTIYLDEGNGEFSASKIP
jgi:type I phosphodiesterase/nucleotide pyrophosphatase